MTARWLCLVEPLDRVLLVEGQDDKHVVAHLCAQSGLACKLQDHAEGGVAPLLASISLELAAPDRLALGVVVDANDDPACSLAGGP